MTNASLWVSTIDGTASLTFDRSTGALSGSLYLGYSDNGMGAWPIGNFAFAAASHPVGATRFSGEFALPGGATGGFFEGQFTGPQASELMVRWLVPWSDPDFGEHGYLFGVLIGRARNE
jgi:hypothetical protein